jgi:hypothetical protein
MDPKSVEWLREELGSQVPNTDAISGADSQFIAPGSGFSLDKDDEPGDDPTSQPSQEVIAGPSNRGYSQTARTPTTSVPKRQTTRRDRAMALKTRIVVTPEIRRVFMLKTLILHREQLLNIKKDFGKAFKRLAEEMAVEFPDYVWPVSRTTKIIKDERRRWREWKTIERFGNGPYEYSVMKAPPEVLDCKKVPVFKMVDGRAVG